MSHTVDHVTELQRKATSVQAQMQAFAARDDLGQLLNLMHRPGWTTIAESALVMAHLEAIQAHMSLVSSMSSNLLKAGSLVGKAQ